MSPDAEIAQSILAAIAKASSKRPARAADVAARIGGDESAYWRVLERLIARRQVVTAHISRPARDPAPWLAIWPTGIHVQGAWSNESHAGLFDRDASSYPSSVKTQQGRRPRIVRRA